MPGWEKWLLDCVAIATVADMVPLTGENRVLVKYGIDVLKKMRRPGIRSILKQRNIQPSEITAETIGFVLAPRINAASRMDHANTAFELLLTENQIEAEWLAKRLEEKNTERRGLVDEILKKLDEKLAGVESPKLIFEGSAEWPAGVLGIAANRLLEKYHCPVFLYSELPGVIKGSCRSFEGVNVVELMRHASDLFSDFGGHAFSGGFWMLPEKLPFLKERLVNALDSGGFEKKEVVVEADFEFTIEDVNAEVFNVISKLQPFGQGNPKPVFLVKDVVIKELRHVGSDQTHVKMKLLARRSLGEGGGDEGLALRSPQGEVGAIYFRGSHNGFKQGDRVDVLAELQENKWNGTSNIELSIVDAVKI